jgi:hypothetical protein
MASPLQLTGFNGTVVRFVTATGCDMKDRGSNPDSVPCPDGIWGSYILLSIGIEALPLSVMGLEHEADHADRSSTDVTNVCSPAN